jgi:hypothetical protein
MLMKQVDKAVLFEILYNVRVESHLNVLHLSFI